MIKKNIVLLSPFFFPEPISTGKFNTEFAKALLKEGHNVTVFCFHPFYPNWKIEKTDEQLLGIEIIRGGKFLKFSNIIFLRRIILELSYTFFLLRNLNRLRKNTDTIISVYPPSLNFYTLFPFLRKSIKKVGIVHDLQELYSENKTGVINKFTKYFIHKIEKKCYQNSDTLIFLSNEMKENAKRLYSLKNTNLFVQYPFVTIENKETNVLKNIFDVNFKHVVYSGALGEKQNPFKLYQFFKKASLEINNVQFHIFSQGQEFNILEKKNKNYDKIKFHKLVENENLKELYNKSNVQIIPQKENTSRGSLPSKLPNLLASKCKIFLITDNNSELHLLFKNKKIGTVNTTWNIDRLIESLKLQLEKNEDFTNQNKIAKKKFTVDKMISLILR